VQRAVAARSDDEQVDVVAAGADERRSGWTGQRACSTTISAGMSSVVRRNQRCAYSRGVSGRVLAGTGAPPAGRRWWVQHGQQHELRLLFEGDRARQPQRAAALVAIVEAEADADRRDGPVGALRSC